MSGLAEHSGNPRELLSGHQQRAMGPGSANCCLAETATKESGRIVRTGEQILAPGGAVLCPFRPCIQATHVAARQNTLLSCRKFGQAQQIKQVQEVYAAVQQPEMEIRSNSKQSKLSYGGNRAFLVQVVLEMIELRETDTARAMLRQTPVFQRLRQDDPDKLLRLERLCNQTYFDIRYLHSGS